MKRMLPPCHRCGVCPSDPVKHCRCRLPLEREHKHVKKITKKLGLYFIGEKRMHKIYNQSIINKIKKKDKHDHIHDK